MATGPLAAIEEAARRIAEAQRLAASVRRPAPRPAPTPTPQRTPTPGPQRPAIVVDPTERAVDKIITRSIDKVERSRPRTPAPARRQPNALERMTSGSTFNQARQQSAARGAARPEQPSVLTQRQRVASRVGEPGFQDQFNSEIKQKLLGARDIAIGIGEAGLAEQQRRAGTIKVEDYMVEAARQVRAETGGYASEAEVRQRAYQLAEQVALSRPGGKLQERRNDDIDQPRRFLNKEIPYSKRAAELAGAGAAKAIRVVPGEAPLQYAGKKLPYVPTPEGVAALIAESTVPTTVWQAALELAPGFGDLRGFVSAMREGAPEAITALKAAAKAEGEQGTLDGFLKTLGDEYGQLGDEADELVTVYHGTGGGLEGDTLRPGTYVTTDRAAAQKYADVDARVRGATGERGRATVHEFQVRRSQLDDVPEDATTLGSPYVLREPIQTRGKRATSDLDDLLATKAEARSITDPAERQRYMQQQGVAKSMEELAIDRGQMRPSRDVLPGVRSSYEPTTAGGSQLGGKYARFELGEGTGHWVGLSTSADGKTVNVNFGRRDTEGAGLGRKAGGNVADLGEMGRFLLDLAEQNPGLRITAQASDSRLAAVYRRLAFDGDGKILTLNPAKLRDAMARFDQPKRGRLGALLGDESGKLGPDGREMNPVTPDEAAGIPKQRDATNNVDLSTKTSRELADQIRGSGNLQTRARLADPEGERRFQQAALEELEQRAAAGDEEAQAALESASVRGLSGPEPGAPAAGTPTSLIAKEYHDVVEQVAEIQEKASPGFIRPEDKQMLDFWRGELERRAASGDALARKVLEETDQVVENTGANWLRGIFKKMRGEEGRLGAGGREQNPVSADDIMGSPDEAARTNFDVLSTRRLYTELADNDTPMEQQQLLLRELERRADDGDEIAQEYIKGGALFRAHKETSATLSTEELAAKLSDVEEGSATEDLLMSELRRRAASGDDAAERLIEMNTARPPNQTRPASEGNFLGDILRRRDPKLEAKTNRQLVLQAHRETKKFRGRQRQSYMDIWQELSARANRDDDDARMALEALEQEIGRPPVKAELGGSERGAAGRETTDRALDLRQTIAPRELAIHAAGATAGGAAGATQGDTPQERFRNALLGAAAGAGLTTSQTALRAAAGDFVEEAPALSRFTDRGALGRPQVMADVGQYVQHQLQFVEGMAEGQAKALRGPVTAAVKAVAAGKPNMLIGGIEGQRMTAKQIVDDLRMGELVEYHKLNGERGALGKTPDQPSWNAKTRATTKIGITGEKGKSLLPPAPDDTKTWLSTLRPNQKGQKGWQGLPFGASALKGRAVKTVADWNKTRAHVEQLVRTGIAGRWWYRDTAAEIMRSVGNDRDAATRMAGILATLSNSASVESNTAVALRILNQWAAGKPIGEAAGTFDQVAKLKAFLDNPDANAGAIGSEKTYQFFMAHLRHIDPEKWARLNQGLPTVDVHVGRAYGYDVGTRIINGKSVDKSVGGLPYKLMSEDILRITDQLNANLAPGEIPWDYDQVQAAMWTAQKASTQGKGLETAVTNYGDILGKHTAAVPFETAPGKTSPGPHSQQFEELAPDRKQAFHERLARVVVDENGVNRIAKLIGLLSPGSTKQQGVFEQATNPMTRVQAAVSAAPGGQKSGMVDEAAEPLLDAMTGAHGYVYSQDAQSWYRVFEDLDLYRQNAAGVMLGRSMTPEEAAALEDALRVAGHDVAIIDHPGGAHILDLRRGAMLPKQPKEVQRAATAEVKQFQDDVDRVVDEVFGPDTEVAGLGYHSNYHTNNWQEAPDGDGYTNLFSGVPEPRRKQLWDLVRRLRREAQSQAKAFFDEGGFLGRRGKKEVDEAVNPARRLARQKADRAGIDASLFDATDEEVAHLEKLILHGDWTEHEGTRKGAMSVLNMLRRGENPSPKQLAQLARALEAPQVTAPPIPKKPRVKKGESGMLGRGEKTPSDISSSPDAVLAGDEGAQQPLDLGPVRLADGFRRRALNDIVKSPTNVAEKFGTFFRAALGTPGFVLNNKKDLAAAVVQMPRTLKTAIDIGWGGRNGWRLFPRHPKAWFRMYGRQLNTLASEEAYQALQANTASLPHFERLKEAGLDFIDRASVTGGDVATTSETGLSRFTSDVPILRQTERAYIAPGNAMRYEIANDTLTKYEARHGVPMPADQLHKYVDHLNAATLRGNTRYLSKVHAEALGSILFSTKGLVSGPQYVAGGLKALADPKLPMDLKMEMAGDVAAYIGAGMGVLGLIGITGYKLDRKGGKPDFASVDMNPHSPTFGQVEVGGLRWNYWGADQSAVRQLILQMPGGGKKVVHDVDVGDVTVDQPRIAAGVAYIGNKIAPGPARTSFDILTNPKDPRTFEGRKLDTPGGFAKNIYDQTVPIPWTTLQQSYKEGGPALAVVSELAELNGFTTSTYDQRASASDIAAFQKAKLGKKQEQAGINVYPDLFAHEYWQKRFNDELRLDVAGAKDLTEVKTRYADQNLERYMREQQADGRELTEKAARAELGSIFEKSEAYAGTRQPIINKDGSTSMHKTDAPDGSYKKGDTRYERAPDGLKDLYDQNRLTRLAENVELLWEMYQAGEDLNADELKILTDAGYKP